MDWLKGIGEYFGGAMYLFAINTIFIAMATFLVLKVLRFPMLKYANSAKRRRIARFAALIAIVVMIPAVWTFIDVLKESNFEHDAKNFISKELESLPNANYIKKNSTYTYNPKGKSIIQLVPFGTDEISDDTKKLLESRFQDYNALFEKTELDVNQVKNRTINNLEYMEELRTRDSLDLMSQYQKITYLEDRVKKLSRLERDQIPFDELIKELKINYEKLEHISFSNEIRSNLTDIDTMKVFNIKWVDSISTNESKINDKKKLEAFLKERLDLDTLVVRSYN